MLSRYTTTGSSEWKLLFLSFYKSFISSKGCYIYVCGKIKMAEAVENTMLEILKHIGNMDTETAQEKFDVMKKNLRYQEDIFG